MSAEGFIPAKKSYLLPVISCIALGEGCFMLSLDCGEITEEICPGQFFSLLCGGNTYLRRPVSVFDCSGGVLRLAFEVRGRGTELLSALRPGDTLDALGPLGHGFPANGVKKAAVIGGGIGIFPLFMLAKALKAGGAEVSAFLGFRTKTKIVCDREFFSVCGAKTHIATDDGSMGFQGFAPLQFSQALAAGEKYDAAYICGPAPMMRAAADAAAMYGIPAYVSLEERMGCGIGACLVCACRLKDKDGRVRTGHVCKDGPVIPAEQWAREENRK